MMGRYPAFYPQPKKSLSQILNSIEFDLISIDSILKNNPLYREDYEQVKIQLADLKQQLMVAKPKNEIVQTHKTQLLNKTALLNTQMEIISNKDLPSRPNSWCRMQ